jgi:hypothetical protein
VNDQVKSNLKLNDLVTKVPLASEKQQKNDTEQESTEKSKSAMDVHKSHLIHTIQSL